MPCTLASLPGPGQTLPHPRSKTSGEEGRVAQGAGSADRGGCTKVVGRWNLPPLRSPLGGDEQPPLGDEAACPSPSQYEEKDKAFKEQLSHLATLLPTLQVRGAGGAGLARY